MKKAILLTALLFALPLAAGAQQADTTQPLVMTVLNRTAAAEADSGNARADETARPGDVLRYRITFTNGRADAVRGVALSNPIPATLAFVGGSASASREDVQVEYSADNGRTWSAEPTEEVLVDGRRVRRPIPPERFTNVRWTVTGQVQPRATVTAEYDTRIRLESAQ
jgi:uncharacterized repeat protein (TIGR01451 family)